MKKQFVAIALGFTFTLISCGKKDYVTDVQIINKSNEDFGKIELYAVGSPKLEKLLIQKSTLNKDGKIESNFSGSLLPNSDGSYLLKIEGKSKSRNTKFGYFTNGSSQDSKINITIESDTILVKTTPRKYGY
jgi:hypothetical protein